TAGAGVATGVYDRIRDDLIAGGFVPGKKLMPQRLAPRYGASPGTLREALLRLAAEGFVDSAEQRGFRSVAPSQDTLWEIANFRILLETEGARLSIENGDVAWEEKLAAAHRRLSDLEREMGRPEATPDQLGFW